MYFSFLTLLAAAHTAAAAPGWADWQSSLYATSTSPNTQSISRPPTSTYTKSSAVLTGNASTSASRITSHRNGWTLWPNATTTTPLSGPASSTANVGWSNWPISGGSSNQLGGRPSSNDQIYSSDVVDNAGRDKWYDQPPLVSVDVPAATLIPIIHWKTDKTDIENIIPCKQNSMYYGTNGDSSAYTTHRMAWVHANFTTDAVLLDNSEFLSYNYLTSSQSLTVTFNDKAAYEIARNYWKADIIMVTNDGKCGADESCFLKVVQLNFNDADLVCMMLITSIDFQSAVSYFDYEWGIHRPTKSSARTGTSTTYDSKQSVTRTHSSYYSSTVTPYSGFTSIASGQSSMTQTRSFSSTITPYPGSTSVTSAQNSMSASSMNSSGIVNYEVDSENESDCTAPANNSSGLPAACLGKDFDDDIDDKYGYTSVTDPAFGTFATQFNDLFSSDPPQPDAEDEAMYAMDEAALNLNEDLDLDFSKRHAKRLIGRLLPKKWRKALAKLIPIKGVTTPLKFEKRLVKLNMVAPKQRKTQKSPWGQQVLIKSAVKTSKTNPQNQGKIEIFCVDCGVQGGAEIFGRAGVSVLNGLETLGARLEFNMALTLKVGIDAQIVYSETFTQNLFTVPLSKTCVKPVICAGPVIKVGTDLVLTAKAQGQLLAGATVAINNAKADLELIPPKVKASGWQPEFRPVFEASGNIDLTADFGLPLALALELDVLNGKFKRDIALVNRPALVANAAFAASASLDAGKVGGGVEATNGCDGIDTSLHLKNDIYVKLPNDKRINVLQVPPKKLASKCIRLTKSQSSNSASKIKAPENSDTATADQVKSGQTTNENTGGKTGSTTGSNENSENTSTAGSTSQQQEEKSSAESPSKDTETNSGDGGSATNPITDTDTTNGDEQTAPISRVRRGVAQIAGRQNSDSTADTVNQDTTPATDSQPTQSGESDVNSPTDTITNPATTADDGELRDTTVADRASGTEVTTDFETPKHGDQAYNLTDGYSIVTLTDTLSNYQLHACADGNLHLFAIDDTIPDYECGSGFTMVTADGTIMADAMARIPIYYPDEMEKLGFSRFRIVNDRSIPKGSKEIVFIPDETEMETGDKATLYYPMTPDNGDGITFYPVVCKYADEQPDKLFLAADAENAIAGLLNPDLRAVLTGGEVSECWNMPLIKGNGSKAAGESDWLSSDAGQATGKTDQDVSPTGSATTGSSQGVANDST